MTHEEQGLDMRSCWRFAFDERPQPYFRMGYAQHAPEELDDAVKRMASALPRNVRPAATA